MTDPKQTPEWDEAVKLAQQEYSDSRELGLLSDEEMSFVLEAALPALRRLIIAECAAKLREWGDLNAPHGHRAEARMVVHEAADFLEGK